MKTETQELIRFKTTKFVSMDYVAETGAILLTLTGKKEDNTIPMYMIEIPKNKVYQILRGLVSYTQRFYGKRK